MTNSPGATAVITKAATAFSKPTLKDGLQAPRINRASRPLIPVEIEETCHFKIVLTRNPPT